MRRLPLADRLRVRTPCDVGWDAMEARDDLGRHRHCARCDLTVHDVSAMTRAEVATLLEARERGERVCLHLTVRASDHAVLVADGHVERARRGPPSRLVAAAVATATAMTACASAPPQAPHADIAVAPVEQAPAPIETVPPPLPAAPAVPEEPAPLPAPVTEPVTPVKVPKKISSPTKTNAPVKSPPPQDILIDGDAW